MKSIPARYVDGQIRAYQTPGTECGPLHPTTTHKVESPDKVDTCAVSPDLACAIYTTTHSVVRTSQDGTPLWQYHLQPRATSSYAPSTQCVFSLDSAWIWAYRPDVEAQRDGPDLLVVLRAETGEEVARRELDTVGSGGQIALHPDGKHILLDVGEGQDGVRLFRAALSTTTAGQEIELYPYGWDDRCFIDISPDGKMFMTVDHGRDDIAFHRFPDGEVLLKVSIEDLGYEMDEDSGFMEDEACIDWNGGFINTDVAAVTITGEKNDKEWHCHHAIDLRTGEQLGRFEGHSRDSYDFIPLGDGTWIVSDSDGNVARHRYQR